MFYKKCNIKVADFLKKGITKYFEFILILTKLMFQNKFKENLNQDW